MYKAKILGKIIKISDKDFKKIVRKYDILNAVEESLGKGFKVPIPCPLCSKRIWGGCCRCPFDVFSTPEIRSSVGCQNLAEKVFGRKTFLYDWGTPISSAWDAIKVERIWRFLLKNFKKVK